MQTLTLSPLHPVFAAEVQGIDLRQPTDADLAAKIEAAMDEFAVLVFRDQVLDESQQMAFTRALGPVDMGLLKVLQRRSRFKEAGMIDISNVDLESQILERDDPRLITMLANQLWHSDSSFKQPSAKYSFLLACILPEQGGETEFADMRAAYDALPDDVRGEIEGLVAEHSAFHSRMQLGDQQYTPEDLAKYPTVEWPVVRTHPGSRRKTLFIGAHATHIVEWPVPEGRLLLAELLEHATQRRFVYRHTWRPGDLVIWDNRAVLHRGRRYDLSRRRELRRSTVEDVRV
ncbi:MAG: TauD/TfdA family dioxygenase [Desulfurellaceae bacterium]|nr:TauD/TfdA family dioxygenase [Desulfurellaceae bacterium]